MTTEISKSNDKASIRKPIAERSKQSMTETSIIFEQLPEFRQERFTLRATGSGVILGCASKCRKPVKICFSNNSDPSAFKCRNYFFLGSDYIFHSPCRCLNRIEPLTENVVAAFSFGFCTEIINKSLIVND